MASPFTDYALEIFKDALLDLKQAKLQNLNVSVATGPHPLTESSVVNEIMTSILEFTSVTNLTLSLPYNPQKSEQSKKLEALKSLIVTQMNLSVLSSYLNFQGLIVFAYDFPEEVENPTEFYMNFLQVVHNLTTLKELKIFSSLSFIDIGILKQLINSLILLPNLASLFISFAKVVLDLDQIMELLPNLPYSSSLKKFKLKFPLKSIIREVDSGYKLV